MRAPTPSKLLSELTFLRAHAARFLPLQALPLFHGLTVLWVCLPAARLQADSLDPWSRRNPLPTAELLRAVAYGNSQFVAVGDAGTIVTSPDGIAWTTRTGAGDNNLSGIGYGNNQFVVVGAGGTIVSSEDGIAWTNHSSGTGHDLRGVIYGNNTFVVTGDFGIILQSAVVSSGLVGSPSVELGPILLFSGVGAQVALTGIAGQTYTIQTSSDLANWSPLTNVHLGTTSGQFIDPAATSLPRRFYRAIGP